MSIIKRKDWYLLEMSTQKLTHKMLLPIKRIWTNTQLRLEWVQILRAKSRLVKTLTKIWCQYWRIENNQMTHIQIYQVKRIVNQRIQRDWKIVRVENCNCPTSVALRVIQTHIRTTTPQGILDRLWGTRILTYSNNLRSMKILFRLRQLSNLKMVRMNILMVLHKLVYNIKDVVLLCNLNLMETNSMVSLKTLTKMVDLVKTSLWW